MPTATEELNESISMRDFVKGLQVRGMQRDADGFGLDGRLLNNVAIDKFGTTSPMDAAAAKEVTKSGMITDVAGLNTANVTPNK